MRALSKGFKRRAVSLATGVVTVAVYVPFMGTRWGIYVAMCVGYTIAAFGLAWSDGKLPLFFNGQMRSARVVFEAHFFFLFWLILWIWFAQFSNPWLPTWVTAEGDHGESWLLFFGLIGIVALLLYEHWWLASKPKQDLQVTDGHSS